ncbi:hypothetical protein [Falsibacillus pallidus]|uniref:hypothetical protein n=1 Tax=Falsibacillus pallidus TaxID=493781 RepID=UPI003D96AA99
MQRNQAYYRHQRNRVIQWKKKFILNAREGDVEFDRRLQQPGRLSKEKLGCSCFMCKYEKHMDIPKPAHKAKWDGMKEAIEEYFLED